jgi:hypothetical protein
VRCTYNGSIKILRESPDVRGGKQRRIGKTFPLESFDSSARVVSATYISYYGEGLRRGANKKEGAEPILRTPFRQFSSLMRFITPNSV